MNKQSLRLLSQSSNARTPSEMREALLDSARARSFKGADGLSELDAMTTVAYSAMLALERTEIAYAELMSAIRSLKAG